MAVGGSCGCNGKGYIYLGSQPYGIVGESYAPCSCPAGEAWIAEQRAMRERMLARYEGERCPSCGGRNLGDVSHTRC